MSLILDALKRAERERRLGQAPDALDELPTPPPPPPEKQGRRRGLAIMGAAAVAALALLTVWRSGLGPSAPIEAPVAVAPPPALATTDAAAFDEEQPAVDPVVSARIEDEGGIASLDDLTGDSPADDREPTEDPEPEAEAPVAAAPQPVPPGPTLYTPSRRSTLAPAAPPPPAPVAAAAPAPPPRPIPAPVPVPEPAPPPEVSQIVLDPPPPRPYAQPPGPIVRFGADGSNEVIPSEPSTPKPSPAAAAPVSVPAPVAKAEPEQPAAEAITPAPSPADLPVLVEPAKPLFVEPTGVSQAAAPEATPPPPVPPPRPVARRPSPPPAPAPSTVGLPRLRDMPPAYRAEFPALSVDVHVYNTDPARRFVLINGRRYGEASALSEGPQIVEIVPDGMVLDWRNERIFYTLGR